MLVISGFAFFISGTALAGAEDLAKMRTIAEAAKLISVEEATIKALAAKPGTVIEVELDDRKWPQGWDYEFEIIDAKTGKVHKVKAGWF